MEEQTQKKKSLKVTLAETAKSLMEKLPTSKSNPTNGRGLLSLVTTKIALMGMSISETIADGIQVARVEYEEKCSKVTNEESNKE